jgi:hypothetical protein
MLDERTGVEPSTVSDCASPEDAATSYFRDVFENSRGIVRSAVVAVWPASEDGTRRWIYDMEAILTPCSAFNADPDEYDVAISACQRP